MQGNLPKDFITLDEAIKLIQSDTRKDPKVDIDFLVRNFAYIAPAHNFTIKLLKRNGAGKIIPNGTRFVQFANEYETGLFEHTVSEKYKELTRKELDTASVKNITTAVTDSENGGNMQAIPMYNTDESTMAKRGDQI